MRTILIIISAVVLILGAGYFAMNSASDSSLIEKKVPLQDKQGSVKELESDGVTAGVYAPYDAEQIAQSKADHILLFFHATWCPSCRALDADIVANANSIPAGVEIYKVDYDIEVALKRQYGVTTQHSIIEISSTGAAKSSIAHPLTLEGVIGTI